MKFEILSIEQIKPSGKYKYIAVVHWHPSRLKPWKKMVKKQAVTDGDINYSNGRHWFYTDTFKETQINDELDRFLKKQEYENQILAKLAT